MYRTSDGQQLAKLFLFNLVSSITADNDFVVLAMADRRLLTLMIADPQDPMVATKIQALPSRWDVNAVFTFEFARYRNVQRQTRSATKTLIQHMEKAANMSSSDDGGSSDDDDDDPIGHQPRTQTSVTPVCLLRFVTRLNGRRPLSKMRNDASMVSQMISYLSNSSERESYCQAIDDSDSDEVVESPQPALTTVQQPCSDDLQDIHQTILQYDEQQIKGLQLANAGGGNLKLVNNYSVTSSTCALI
jgi:hypothetical protein